MIIILLIIAIMLLSCAGWLAYQLMIAPTIGGPDEN
jgi:flagellar basal body-associated protein FliL